MKYGFAEEFADAINAFKSRNNPDVENFLKKNAIQFCKMKQAITYLVLEEENGDLLAYFTLAFKIMEFPLESLSKSMIKILERNGNRTENTIQVPGMLLARYAELGYTPVSERLSTTGKPLFQLIKKL